MGQSTEMGMYVVRRKQGLFLSVYVDNIKDGGKETEHGFHVEEIGGHR